MPQMNKGGKYIFGKSLIRENGRIRLPPMAVSEYAITDEGRVYLFTGSKSTGGFCTTRRSLLEPSKLSHILKENPALLTYSANEGEFIRYKGRSYCWTSITPEEAGAGTGSSGLIAACSWYGVAVHTLQRYRLHHGRKGIAVGKSETI